MRRSSPNRTSRRACVPRRSRRSAGFGDEGAEESNQALSSLEKRHIMKVIAETGGNKARAARQLGLSRRALYRRLERYGLAHPEQRPSFADEPVWGDARRAPPAAAAPLYCPDSTNARGTALHTTRGWRMVWRFTKSSSHRAVQQELGRRSPVGGQGRGKDHQGHQVDLDQERRGRRPQEQDCGPTASTRTSPSRSSSTRTRCLPDGLSPKALVTSVS